MSHAGKLNSAPWYSRIAVAVLTLLAVVTVIVTSGALEWFNPWSASSRSSAVVTDSPAPPAATTRQGAGATSSAPRSSATAALTHPDSGTSARDGSPRRLADSGSPGSPDMTASLATRTSPVTFGLLEVEGFTEPFRTIHLAAEEMGTVETLLVREGEAVAAGQPVARLNSSVLLALLAVAEQNTRSQGRLDAAAADLQLRRDRLDKLVPLRADGHARQEEVDRARLEVAVAEANVRSAQEEQMIRQLERDKIKAQIACRTIHAPVAGVIARIHKQLGEFVAPNSPDVLTLVQLDQLLANFTVTSEQAAHLAAGAPASVWFQSSEPVAAVIEYLSPVTNAESGTVLVKLRIDNAAGQFRSGERCRWRLAE